MSTMNSKDDFISEMIKELNTMKIQYGNFETLPPLTAHEIHSKLQYDYPVLDDKDIKILLDYIHTLCNHTDSILPLVNEKFLENIIYMKTAPSYTHYLYTTDLVAAVFIALPTYLFKYDHDQLCKILSLESNGAQSWFDIIHTVISLYERCSASLLLSNPRQPVDSECMVANDTVGGIISAIECLVSAVSINTMRQPNNVIASRSLEEQLTIVISEVLHYQSTDANPLEEGERQCAMAVLDHTVTAAVHLLYVLRDVCSLFPPAAAVVVPGLLTSVLPPLKKASIKTGEVATNLQLLCLTVLSEIAASELDAKTSPSTGSIAIVNSLARSVGEIVCLAENLCAEFERHKSGDSEDNSSTYGRVAESLCAITALLSFYQQLEEVFLSSRLLAVLSVVLYRRSSQSSSDQPFVLYHTLSTVTRQRLLWTLARLSSCESVTVATYVHGALFPMILRLEVGHPLSHFSRLHIGIDSPISALPQLLCILLGSTKHQLGRVAIVNKQLLSILSTDGYAATSSTECLESPVDLAGRFVSTLELSINESLNAECNPDLSSKERERGVRKVNDILAEYVGMVEIVCTSISRYPDPTMRALVRSILETTVSVASKGNTSIAYLTGEEESGTDVVVDGELEESQSNIIDFSRLAADRRLCLHKLNKWIKVLQSNLDGHNSHKTD